MTNPEQLTIERVLNSKATPEEVVEVVRWFATPEGQLWLSARIDDDSEKLPLRTGNECSEYSIPSDLIYGRIINKVRRLKVRRMILRFAAAFVPLVIIAGLCYEAGTRAGWLAQSASLIEFNVPYGERLHIAFQDGSSVYLNSGSHIRYPSNFGLFERRIEMEGEGWFSITEDRRRPFIVDLNEVGVKVTGTTFNVKAYPEEDMISISLESGMIDVTGNTFSPVSVKPGEEAVYSRLSRSCNIIRPEKILSSSAWKTNKLIFTDSPLQEVMTTMTRAFNISFIIEDTTALKYSYTLETSNKDIHSILKELEKITPVRFDYNGGTIRVFMKKI